jgi:hypothetical protein
MEYATTADGGVTALIASQLLGLYVGQLLGVKILKEERSILRHTPIRKQLDSVDVAAVVGG